MCMGEGVFNGRNMSRSRQLSKWRDRKTPSTINHPSEREEWKGGGGEGMQNTEQEINSRKQLQQIAQKKVSPFHLNYFKIEMKDPKAQEVHTQAASLSWSTAESAVNAPTHSTPSKATSKLPHRPQET